MSTEKSRVVLINMLDVIDCLFNEVFLSGNAEQYLQKYEK